MDSHLYTFSFCLASHTSVWWLHSFHRNSQSPRTGKGLYSIVTAPAFGQDHGTPFLREEKPSCFFKDWGGNPKSLFEGRQNNLYMTKIFPAVTVWALLFCYCLVLFGSFFKLSNELENNMKLRELSYTCGLSFLKSVAVTFLFALLLTFQAF